MNNPLPKPARLQYTDDMYDEAFLEEHKKAHPNLVFEPLADTTLMNGCIMCNITGTPADLENFLLDVYDVTLRDVRSCLSPVD